MRQSIEAFFPQCIEGKCIETEQGDFQIFDSEQEPKRCYIRKNEEEPTHFSVLNPAQKEVNFLAIDKCILYDNAKEHCDFAVFDDTRFSFVEIKARHPLHKRRLSDRKKARQQLQETILHFQENGIEFKNINLEAIICLEHV
ncbi:hypothetical protein [Runella aurantiaca]|uniref:Uncharacterized protein n=1 Tax=Runella aurantiaca TaxID=2282308 RepID=A0A369HZ69_9BACT|nr:hypothetical protein [Runella aurantiaca]RDB02809.1 hypothetical protein DVG78_26630 [Runella aurantiaca]